MRSEGTLELSKSLATPRSDVIRVGIDLKLPHELLGFLSVSHVGIITYLHVDF